MVQSGGLKKSVLSVFKRNNSGKTPRKLGSPSKAEVVASPLSKRLFSFSPAKQQASNAPPGSSHKRAQRVENDGDLIPVGVGYNHAASRLGQAAPQDDDGSNIKVVVRVRPRSDREANLGGAICVQPLDTSCIRLGPPAETHTFSFDHVAAENATQEDIYEVAGRPVVDSCLQGFNGCLLAYGQTGSGKTYSMLGPCDATSVSLPDDHQRGLIQRIFEHLFAELHSQAGEGVEATVSCSFLEIYNETISDLLCPGTTALALREDSKKGGVFVEGLLEEKVTSVDHVTSLLHCGIANRRVGETQMNERSSRSHSVFTAAVERRVPSSHGGAPTVMRSRLHLVDLAGSERQKTSGAAGERLKEASSINKSLSTLGLVIMSLVDQQQGRQRHIPYRDSKLTFLLQDSLGGNAKTVLVAAVSPAAVNAAETLGTLRFANDAKRIKNKAVVNEDLDGDVDTLRLEIRRLKEELSRSRASEPSTPERNAKQLSSPGMVMPLTTGGRAMGGEAARRALVGALRREEAVAAEVAALQEQLEGVRALVTAKDADLNRTQMMLKLKESRLARSAGGAPPNEVAVSLQSEIDILKARLDAHPEVKRFAVENLHLSQEVARLQGMVDRGEVAALGTDVAVLRREMVGMADALDAAQEAAEMAVAEAESARAAKEAAETQLGEAQSALAEKEAAEELHQRIAVLSAEKDELTLVAVEAETLREEVARMVAHAGGLEAECESLKASLGVKSKEADDLDVAYHGVTEQLATAWEDISTLEAEVSKLSSNLQDAEAAHVSYREAAEGEAAERAAAAATAIVAVQRELLERGEQVEKLTSVLDSATKEIDALKHQISGREEELKAMTANVTELESSLVQERARANAAETATKEAVQTVAQIETLATEAAKNATAEMQRADGLAQELGVASAALAEARSKVASLSATSSRLEAESSALSSELTASKNDVTTTKAEVERLRGSLSTAQHRLSEVQAELEQVEDSKAELAYELSDKSASLTEVKERLASTQASLEITKEAKAILEKRKAELKVEVETVTKARSLAERERFSLSKRIEQLEDELEDAHSKLAAAAGGPLEQEQQLLLTKAELKETKEALARTREAAAKLSDLMKEKDAELARIRSDMAMEVNDAAQQVQELLAAQSRAEAAEARAAELASKLRTPPPEQSAV